MGRKMSEDTPYLVIGIIDAYGAIHHRPIKMGEAGEKTHDYFWPGQTHKRWRFMISDWQLQKSMLSKDSFTSEEVEQIYTLLRKHYTPPLWQLQGEEWEALGRPRSGKAYEKHCKKWDAIYRKSKRQSS